MKKNNNFKIAQRKKKNFTKYEFNGAMKAYALKGVITLIQFLFFT